MLVLCQFQVVFWQVLKAARFVGSSRLETASCTELRYMGLSSFTVEPITPYKGVALILFSEAHLTFTNSVCPTALAMLSLLVSRLLIIAPALSHICSNLIMFSIKASAHKTHSLALRALPYHSLAFQQLGYTMILLIVMDTVAAVVGSYSSCWTLLRCRWTIQLQQHLQVLHDYHCIDRVAALITAFCHFDIWLSSQCCCAA